MNFHRCVKCFTKNAFRLINRRLYNSLLLKENVQAAVAVRSLTAVQFQIRKYSEAENLSDQPHNLITVPELKFGDLNFNDAVSHEHLVSKLQNCKSIEEQIDTLISTLSLTHEDIQARHSFCRSLEELFKPFFKNFRINIYGSTVNCFGFKGCDLDLTFETNDEELVKNKFLESPDPPFVSEVVSGKASLDEIAALPPKEKLLFIHLVFLDYYKDSFDPPIFINAEVPLVRFHHDKFKLKCDLTFKNSVAYSNTKMLYLYAKMDPRVSHIMMTIRYWAKHTELVGKGLLFNTYTFSLLVLYFLQSRNPPVIPSAEYMMSFVDEFEMKDINEKRFSDILNKLPPSRNTQTSVELLKEFFLFYLYFDFTRVICPLTSTAVPREEFFSKPENRRFRMNSICVQDPMCLTHNVAEFPGFKSCKKFFNHLTEACHVFLDPTYDQPSCEKPWGLMKLLEYPEKPPVPTVLSIRIPCGDREKAETTAKAVLEILEQVLLIDCKVLQQKDVMDLLNKRDAIQKPKTRKFASRNQPLKLSAECEPVSELQDSSTPSLVDQFQSVLDSGNELLLSAKCVASKNVWLGRDLPQVESSINLKQIKSMEDQTESSKNMLRRERQVSEDIVETVAKINQQQNMGEKKPKMHSFLLECFAPETWQGDILVNCRPLKKTTFNPVLGIFLKEYVPKVVKRMSENQ